MQEDEYVYSLLQNLDSEQLKEFLLLIDDHSGFSELKDYIMKKIKAASF